MAAVTGLLALGAAIDRGVLVEPLAAAGYARRAATVDIDGAGAIVIADGLAFGPVTATWRPLTVLALFAPDGITILHAATFPAFQPTVGQHVIVPAGTYAATAINAGPAPTVIVAEAIPVTLSGDPLVQEF